MFEYKAFISYRHKPLDHAAAVQIQKLLEAYRLPRNVKGKNRKIGKVFRDESELMTSNDLGEEILKALEKSEYLIVICSEYLLESEYCKTEINYFKELHNGRTDHILPVIVSGEPKDVIPEQLLTESYSEIQSDGTIKWIKREVEPLCCDIRESSQQKMKKRLKTEFLRLAAPMLGCSFDELFQREKRRRRRKYAVYVCIMFAVIGGVYYRLTEYHVYENGLQYRLRGNEAVIVGYEGDQDTLVIPLEIEGKKIREVDLTKLPEGIQIYYEASEKDFDYEINDLEDCVWLKDYHGEYHSIQIPETIEGKKVTTISERGFQETELEHVILPETLIEIRSGAFAHSKLKSVYLPNGISEIKGGAFASCFDLTDFEIPDRNKNYYYIQGWICSYSGNAVSFISDNEDEGKSFEKYLSNYYPFRSILNYACWNNEYLKEVELNSECTFIGKSAFENCVNLEKVYIPEKMYEIGKNAFRGCKKLKEVTIPRKCYVNEGAFEPDVVIQYYE